MTNAVRYVFEGTPEIGTTMQVAPGVHWLRMPLPFKLDHINLWLLEDGDGWTAVDTGIVRDGVKEAWESLFARYFVDRPLKRVIVTHFHPDHMGLAGWLCERFGVDLWVTSCEWAFARIGVIDTGEALIEGARRLYRAAGFDDALLATVATARGIYPTSVSPVPVSYRRLGDGDVLSIGDRSWRVMVGAGHSPEHACLYCGEIGVLISGDHILPRISPNVSVWPREPEADPLRFYLDSLPVFKRLPADTLVLPSHDWPFGGLHERLDDLIAHHHARLDDTVAACAAPSTGVEVLHRLFDRDLDRHQLFFAIGETLAHLHFLMGEGKIERTRRPDGVNEFSRS
jgi:glyoxylase-like metal-dependent hydrolase (beta-lactamase superfamily II)